MIAGVLLLTVPAKTNENEHNNVNGVSATEIVDGHEYAVLDVYNDTPVNTGILDFMDKNYYVKFVLQDDLFYTITNDRIAGTDARGLGWNGTYHGGSNIWVILDLNGHSIDVASTFFSIATAHIVICDSSPTGTGEIKCLFIPYSGAVDLQVDIYGGKISTLRPHNSVEDHTLSTVVNVYGGVVDYLELDPRYSKQGSFIDLVVDGGYVAKMDPSITNINGQEYKLTNVYRNTSLETITSATSGNAYNKLVLQDDLYYTVTNDSTNGVPTVTWNTVYGSNAHGGTVILDLNGHSIAGAASIGWFAIQAEHLSIYDSSSTGTGSIKLPLNCFQRRAAIAVDIYSGTLGKMMVQAQGGDYDVDVALNVYGGAIDYVDLDERYFNGRESYLDFAVYGGYVRGAHHAIVVPAFDEIDANGAIHPYAGYALSNSAYLSGAYNYEIGVAWELSLLQALAKRDGQYYLWGRKTGGSYAYLNVIYQSGILLVAEPEISVA